MERVSGHYGASFPHDCPGDDCAIARWIRAKATNTEYLIRNNAPPDEVERIVIYSSIEIGKTWPELVADLIGKSGETC